MTEFVDLAAALSDRYTIERELGRGGMATVFLAQDVKHDRKVAVKVLRPELAAIIGAERFVQEIRVTANLQHPHILALHDSGEADGFLYYVMPYVAGESLRAKLNREKQLSVDEAVDITTAVASALDYAHRQNVIHRDIKPENILLHDGEPLVADFGIALAVSAAGGTRITETGLSLGTPHYMSPEQATADRELTARSDIYSLACVTYEMLVGDPPHTGSTAQAIISKVVTEEPSPVSTHRKTVPPNIDAALGKALQKLPADRFETASECAEALTNPHFVTPVPAARTGAAAVTAPALSKLAPVSRFAWPAATIFFAALALWGWLTSRDAEPNVIRFSLTMPAEQAMNLSRLEDAPFAISPDGSRLAYVGPHPRGGTTSLYLRTLDQLDPIPIPGTEDALAPFFSPDGLWIGFHTGEDRKLKKVALGGGPPITLAAGVHQRLSSAWWGDDGHIVFASQGARLSRVDAAGGEAEVLLTREQFELAMRWPVVLPGGKGVLFEQCSAACGEHDVALLNLETREVKVLIEDGARAWYVPTGHLVYALADGSIYAVAFDLKRLELTGSPVPLFEGVRMGAAFGPRLALSRSGAMMYLPGGGGGERHVVAVDREGRERPLIDQPNAYSHPRLSPSGDRIALTIFSGGGGQDATQIWVYDITSGTLSQLTLEGANQRPTWAADGNRIAFASNRTGEWDLFWKPADGSGPAERVASGDDPDLIITSFWTRDGKWIVADGILENEAEGIVAIPVDGDRAAQTIVSSAATEMVPAVSPNGRWLGYVSDESGQDQVYVRPFPETGGRWQISTAGGATPLWASDRELVYWDLASRAMELAVLEFGSSVRVVERQKLFDLRPYVFDVNVPMYDVSRDGQEFILIREQLSERSDPVLVLDWFEEIERRVAEQAGGR